VVAVSLPQNPKTPKPLEDKVYLKNIISNKKNDLNYYNWIVCCVCIDARKSLNSIGLSLITLYTPYFTHFS